MLKQRILLLLALCFAAPAQAGMFTDDDAHKQIRQLEVQAAQLEERVLRLENATEHQTKALLDLQGQIGALNDDIRRLHGKNEELVHGLKDAEKRDKDFYVDLDTRLRRFELTNNAATTAEGETAASGSFDPDDPSLENRAYEAAYGLFKGESHENSIAAFQEFISKFPNSFYIAKANYWLGKGQLALKDYDNALVTFQNLLKAYPRMSKAPDALYGIAECQIELNQSKSASKTLKLLTTKYPESEAAEKAKTLLTTVK